MTMIEAYHGRIRASAWSWVLSRVKVEPVTRDVADAAIALLAETGLHGREFAIDAALAVIASSRLGRVTVRPL
ncbi:hypothetical protein [Streptomyces sp. ISL-100]|uniref:hypothetical protein n=1 Tax=Streptomyces sp. ISL-100 TaxID=2819173 RepID=UPI002034D920|nr:hypothetical protein [Streptomyces sp. ISL-100]